ncbi:MAG: DUF763 domain-containing protein [Nitrososphaerota archaeon]|nr:DUF763 domain-containing protein [Candidatus Bathyarchaeota archaeon]MDW8049057.1 DUF763 domain-containing protein [Nitrososphaerota archaeon]
MRRTGFAELPLHNGHAPQWLVKRMIRLAEGIVTVLIDEFGRDAFLERISDPYWFQALGCVLGYDWHSSGVTTVATGVLKSAIDPEKLGVVVCGGKGKSSKNTLSELESVGEKFGLSSQEIFRLKYASRMSAKVDNAAVQDGYKLYHHAFFVIEDGSWAVVQQGMSLDDRTARRYHWLSKNLESFVEEPHEAIVGDKRREITLNMTAMESEGCRKASVDIAKERPWKIIKMLKSIRPAYQRSLQEWIRVDADPEPKKSSMAYLYLPSTINWKTLERVYEFQPSNYEDLLGIKGVGPATVRGLALIAELIYGERPSWRDPVKYSFAYGGKDGVPFPVDRGAMDESIQVLRECIEIARLGNKEKLSSLRRLMRFAPPSRKVDY